MKNLVIILLFTLGALSIEAQIPKPQLTKALTTEGDSLDLEEHYKNGQRYLVGDGVFLDKTKAAAYFRKAAEGGLAKAQYVLGVCYANGQGVPQDYAAEVKWLLKAADQGLAAAEFRLGIAHLNGKGVPKDPAKGIDWLRKAAGHTNAQAQCVLGIEYFMGRVVPQNYGEASKWLNQGLSQVKAADMLMCTRIIPPPVNPPKVEINGVELSPGKQASVHTVYGVAAIKCLAVEKETVEILVEGEDTPRTLDKSGPVDIIPKLFQRAREARARVERQVSATVDAQTATPGVQPLIIHGPPIYSPSRESNRRHSPEVSAGTGFFVTDDGYLLTCEHVVHGATHFYIKGPQGALSAKLVKADSTLDVALLKVDGVFRALAVNQQQASLGQAVFTVGFPNPDVQGVTPKLTRGEISSLAGIRDNPRYFQISVPVQPGNSGGALMDESGNVVGVVTARLDDVATYERSGALPQNVNYAVKAGLVNDFLSKVPELSGKLKLSVVGRGRDAATGAAELASVLILAQ